MGNYGKYWTIEEIKDGLLEVCRILGRTPLTKELKDYDCVPSCPKTIKKFIKEIGYNTYFDFCEDNGYEVVKNNKRLSYTFDSICDVYKEFYNIYGFYPNSNNMKDFNTEIKIPSWSTVKKITSDRFHEFCKMFDLDHINKPKSYAEYCKIFIEISKSKGRPLKYSELINNEYGLPDSRWFVKYCSDKSVTNYNQFLLYLNLKPRYDITKEIAVGLIREKYLKLNRNLYINDFKNVNENEIGVAVINRHWGSFNNMLKELGIPINQEGMSERHRSINQLIYDIIKLCKYIESTEGRRVISRDDVKNAEWCLSPQNYDRWFKQYFNINLAKFVDDLGYQFNKAGMGMTYVFPDGEKTTSKLEFIVSNFLRDNNVTYIRNAKYMDFIKDYKFKKMSKDCDYVIEIDGMKWYVEIAGMLDYRKISKKYDDNIRKRYKKQLHIKEQMLIENNLDYKILYPHDFDKPLDEVFSFLYENLE